MLCFILLYILISRYNNYNDNNENDNDDNDDDDAAKENDHIMKITRMSVSYNYILD